MQAADLFKRLHTAETAKLFDPANAQMIQIIARGLLETAGDAPEVYLLDTVPDKALFVMCGQGLGITCLARVTHIQESEEVNNAPNDAEEEVRPEDPQAGEEAG
jgi:hypothetical protein